MKTTQRGYQRESGEVININWTIRQTSLKGGHGCQLIYVKQSNVWFLYPMNGLKGYGRSNYRLTPKQAVKIIKAVRGIA